MNKQHIFSLYRSYLRQVRALPHIYLRQFFTIKGADDFRSLLKAKSVKLRKSKLKRVSKDLQRLRAANGGKTTAFDRMLDIAYGRTGKLRWELMEPLLSDTDTSSIPPANPQREKTCLPIYSPELVALLTSSISRTTKPLQKHQLLPSSGLSGCPKSDSDRMLLGLPSKRREYNIRWRFFKNECGKVYPPLEVSQKYPSSRINTHMLSDSSFNFDSQNLIHLQELLVLAGLPSRSPDPSTEKRRQRNQKVFDANPFDGSLPLRWLQRRYQALLGRAPLLAPRPLPQGNHKCTYDVQLASGATTTSRPHPSRLRFVDAEDISWIDDINP